MSATSFEELLNHLANDEVLILGIQKIGQSIGQSTQFDVNNDAKRRCIRLQTLQDGSGIKFIPSTLWQPYVAFGNAFTRSVGLSAFPAVKLDAMVSCLEYNKP